MAKSKKKLIVVGNGPAGLRFLELFKESRGSEEFAVTTIGEEPRPAYDRVQLTEYFAHRDARQLEYHDRKWYREQKIELICGVRVSEIHRDKKEIVLSNGKTARYEQLVLATGSKPFVPPLPGADGDHVFVYRTIEDMEAIVKAAETAQRAAVIGGGLLGLEAARALKDLGLEVHVLEMAPRLMAAQLDARGGALLNAEILRMGVHTHLEVKLSALAPGDAGLRVQMAGREDLPVDMVVISAGIRPRDELARQAGLALGTRGGIAVDDLMRTSDPAILALGECASHRDRIYGLIAPCYQMADTAVGTVLGMDKPFTGADLSAKLKLMGVEVASIGQSVLPPGADPASVTSIVLEDELSGAYKKLVVDRATRKLIGAVLVGSTADYGQLVGMVRNGEAIPETPVSFLIHAGDSPNTDPATLGDQALVCTCNNVSAGRLRETIGGGCRDLPTLCKITSAGTGCGGCKPQVAQLLTAQLCKMGVEVNRSICEHIPHTRQELLHLIMVKELRSFNAVIEAVGKGAGCEVCKPVVASILASSWAQVASDAPVIQDTNDRYMANIQRGGTYSVVPRVPAGEITPEKLIAIGQVAKKYDLYTKITGGQRIDLFGARVDQLPDIWEELIAAGFESGHAYAKAMRTVKSCVGAPWCRYGLLDSTQFAIRIEHRYKGLRAPHKLKSAVSGCIRECAEARGKDFGLIATEQGWNLYVGGNGGARPRHAELLASGLDEETCIKYMDRFLAFYIRTADPLTRTSAWIEGLEGGLDYLKDVIIKDSLGIAADLDRHMASLVGNYRCEWKAVLENPAQRARFKSFINSGTPDPSVRFVKEREQIRPASGGGAEALAQRDKEVAHA